MSRVLDHHEHSSNCCPCCSRLSRRQDGLFSWLELPPAPSLFFPIIPRLLNIPRQLNTDGLTEQALQAHSYYSLPFELEPAFPIVDVPSLFDGNLVILTEASALSGKFL